MTDIQDPQLASLWEALRKNQQDWDLYRVLADFYEEAGDNRMAGGLRWLADNQKRPYSSFRFSWYTFSGNDYGDPWSDLEGSITKYLTATEKRRDGFFYEDFDSAILDCINALSLRQIAPQSDLKSTGSLLSATLRIGFDEKS